MAALGQRTRWSPPVTAKIDWSHPAAAGLKSFVVCGIDYVGNRVITSGSPPHGADSPFGRSRNHAGGAGFVVPGVRPLQAPGVSFLAVARKASSANPNPFILGVSGNTGTAWGYGLYSPSGGSDLRWINGGVAIASLGFTLGINQWRCIVAVGSAGSQTSVQGWVDGVGSAAMSLAGSTAPLNDFSIGGCNGTTGGAVADPWEGDVAVGAVWARALEPALAQSLSADPFQFLRW